MSVPNLDQRAAWDGDSGARWARDADRRDRVLAPIAELLLRCARIQAGDVVVDIGCGCGTTTHAAADATGAAGSARGVDLSRPMLEVARSRASGSNRAAIEFTHGDAQVDPLGGPYDIAISRFGTMFFDDPVVAFANIASHMRGRGRLCIATWQPLANNDWLVVPGAALLDFADLPDQADASGPGMFAQSDPSQIASVLASAGWDDVTTTPHSVPITIGTDVDDAVDYLAKSGPGRSMVEAVPPERIQEALAAVRETLIPYRTAGGVTLSAGVLITAAVTRE